MTGTCERSSLNQLLGRPLPRSSRGSPSGWQSLLPLAGIEPEASTLANRKRDAEAPVVEQTNKQGRRGAATSPTASPASAQDANRCESVHELATDPEFALAVLALIRKSGQASVSDG